MLINCQNCQKIVSSYREICPHCQKKAVMKKEKNFLWRFWKIFNKTSEIFFIKEKKFSVK